MAVKQRLNRGSLIKRHGAWHLKYYAAGKQKMTKVCDVSDQFRSKQDVIPEANKMLARIAPNPDQPHTSNLKIVDFYEQVYEPWAKQECRPATYNGYVKLWSKHLKGHFADRLLYEYEPHHATEYLTRLAEGGTLGRHALSHIRAMMSGVFAQAVARGYLKVNPIHDAMVLSKIKKPSKPTPHYTVQEMAAILEALRNDKLSRAVMVLSFIGLRPSEARALRWDDLDIESGVLHVRRSAWRKHIAEGGKSERSVRAMMFGPFYGSMLEDHRRSLPVPTSYVLENGAGNPLDLWAYAGRSIRPTLKAAGIMWKAFYAGRRGSETEMMRHTNGNTQLTAPQFGHTQRVAEAHYVKPLPDETRKAALALDSALSTALQGTTVDR
ncbi:MAG: tyrosine-type recombinase/integrase [Terriglobales bacterium]